LEKPLEAREINERSAEDGQLVPEGGVEHQFPEIAADLASLEFVLKLQELEGESENMLGNVEKSFPVPPKLVDHLVEFLL